MAARMKFVKSYRQSYRDGQYRMTTRLKFGNGRLVRVKTETDGTWALAELDKHAMYVHRGGTDTVLKGPLSRMSHSTVHTYAREVSDDVVDGMPCWKVRWSTAYTTWTDKQYGLCRQSMDNHGKIRIVTYQQFNAVPDNEFDVPKGLKVVERSRAFRTNQGRAKRQNPSGP